MFAYILPLADEHPAANDESPIGSVANPAVNQRAFLKLEDINPFYVLPVTSGPLFPQFKGPRNPGVVRVGRQQGMWFAVSGSLKSSNCLMCRENLVES